MTGAWVAIVWLVIAVVLFIIEGLTVQLVCVWFACGSLVAMLASLMGAPPVLQLVLFFITSVAVLIFGRPFLKEKLTPKKTATNADALIGQNGIVTEEIDNGLGTGRVDVSGLGWAARSAGGEVIPARQAVTVRKIEGVKLIVEPAENNSEERV